MKVTDEQRAAMVQVWKACEHDNLVMRAWAAVGVPDDVIDSVTLFEWACYNRMLNSTYEPAWGV